MFFISHRGNIDGIKPELENTQLYIDEAIALGYDVEIDVWEENDKLYLGHDKPEREVDFDWLLERKEKLWVHTKNFNALYHLLNSDLRIFYHEKENHTIINNCNIIWSHELREANKLSIIPLLSLVQVEQWFYTTKPVFGVCSDYIRRFKYNYENFGKIKL